MVDIKQIELEQEMLNYSGEDQVLSSDEVLKRFIAEQPKGERISTKLPNLDRTIGGLYPGQLIVVSGVTGHGKTTLCQTFTKNMSEQLTFPLWFSYEVGTQDFIENFHPDYQKHIFMPLKMTDNSLKWIESRIIESKVKYNTTICFIDHIHYLVSMSAKTNMSFVIGECVRGLKQLAIKHNIVIVLVAHMTKTKPDEEPGLGHTRDSSFIEQEADVVLYVWRDGKEKSITICKVAKNRKRGVIDEKIGLVLIDGKYQEVVLKEETER
jgi:replicative DNA helicase